MKSVGPREISWTLWNQLDLVTYWRWSYKFPISEGCKKARIVLGQSGLVGNCSMMIWWLMTDDYHWFLLVYMITDDLNELFEQCQEKQPGVTKGWCLVPKWVDSAPLCDCWKKAPPTRAIATRREMSLVGQGLAQRSSNSFLGARSSRVLQQCDQAKLRFHTHPGHLSWKEQISAPHSTGLRNGDSCRLKSRQVVTCWRVLVEKTIRSSKQTYFGDL